MKRTNPQSTVKNAALRLLARRDHSFYELKLKLLARRFQVSEIDKVLQELQEQNWLSEHRFVQSFIAYRHERNFGPLKIQADLQARGVSNELIEALLWDQSLDWSTSLAKLCDKKFAGEFSVQPQERAKQIQFLQRRGYTLDQITQLINLSK